MRLVTGITYVIVATYKVIPSPDFFKKISPEDLPMVENLLIVTNL